MHFLTSQFCDYNLLNWLNSKQMCVIKHLLPIFPLHFRCHRRLAETNYKYKAKIDNCHSC